MFTGIVQGTANVIKIKKKTGLQSHTIVLPENFSQQIEVGASIAHNGCCLTVTEKNKNHVTFDLMQETLRLTNLGDLSEGDMINFERAAKYGDEIGGHIMSGHIIETATITDIISSENNKTLWLKVPEKLIKYILPKGFVGLNGCSLTIGDVSGNTFSVHLIPETLDRTTFGQSVIGERINLEIDANTQAIVDTVERVMKQKMDS
ncbi:riboflavin synthase subunit alpha [Vibrio salinus]|uniref:riboflavin synthase subunit alpha n=1 Tax=Vibrio salinus TaxID=2899784 RepID=UPI001E4960C7|nr:riboflavin synthase subunit alpha [Vibrio salinus]MCE0492516.1 riboflavin synthase subunit alpha [Vibrio salinus]